MNIDTSILALVTLRVMTHAAMEPFAGDAPRNMERWQATLHGMRIIVLFDNRTDRWSIAANEWTATFRFYPSAPLAENPTEENPDWFGSWGKITEGLVTGDFSAFLRDLTLLRVALKGFEDQHHTYVDFQEARIGP